MSKFSFTTAVLLIAGLLSTTAANALTLTNDCAEKITSTDQQLVIDALDVLVDHKDSVEDHINDSLEARNPYRYVAISSEKMNRWRKRVDRLVDGSRGGCRES